MLEGSTARLLGSLLGETGPRLEEVKRNLYRSVFRVPELGDGIGRLYLKRYRFPRLGDKLKGLWRNRAKTEWRNARELWRLGIPTFAPLAHGLETRWGLPHEAILVSREIEDADPLDRFLETLPGERRPELLRETARLVAALHRHAVHHRDLHQSNCLARLREKVEIFLVDLHTVRVGGELTEREKVSQLARLLHGLRGTLRREEMLRFLEEYLRESGERLGEPPALLERLEQRIQRIERRHACSRDKRCLVRSSAFAVRKGLFRRLYRRRELEARAILAAIAEHRRILSEAREDLVLKREGRSRVTRLPAPAAGPPLCVKEIGPGGPLAFLEGIGCGSRGKRAWKGAHALTRRAIPTPRAFALEERCFLGIPVRTYLLTEYLEGTTSVWEFLETTYPALPREDRRRFLQALAHLVASLHRENLYHRDLQLRNLLVRRQAEPGSGERGWQILVIDLESLAPGPRLDERRRLRNLMQLLDSPLTVGRTDKQRFLKLYETFLGRRHGKEEVREVVGLLGRRRSRAARIEAGVRG